MKFKNNFNKEADMKKVARFVMFVAALVMSVGLNKGRVANAAPNGDDVKNDEVLFYMPVAEYTEKGLYKDSADHDYVIVFAHEDSKGDYTVYGKYVNLKKSWSSLGFWSTSLYAGNEQFWDGDDGSCVVLSAESVNSYTGFGYGDDNEKGLSYVRGALSDTGDALIGDAYYGINKYQLEGVFRVGNYITYREVDFVEHVKYMYNYPAILRIIQHIAPSGSKEDFEVGAVEISTTNLKALEILIRLLIRSCDFPDDFDLNSSILLQQSETSHGLNWDNELYVEAARAELWCSKAGELYLKTNENLPTYKVNDTITNTSSATGSNVEEGNLAGLSFYLAGIDDTVLSGYKFLSALKGAVTIRVQKYNEYIVAQNQMARNSVLRDVASSLPEVFAAAFTYFYENEDSSVAFNRVGVEGKGTTTYYVVREGMSDFTYEDGNGTRHSNALLSAQRTAVTFWDYVYGICNGVDSLHTLNVVEGGPTLVEIFSGEALPVTVHMTEGGYSAEAAKAYADEVINKWSSERNKRKTITNAMVYFNDIVKYQLPRVYGYSTGEEYIWNQVTEDMIPEGTLSRCEMLESMTPGLEPTAYGYTIRYELPSVMSNIRVIADSTEAYTAYAQIMYLLMYANTYVSTQGFGPGENNIGWRTEDVELEMYLQDLEEKGSAYLLDNISADLSNRILAYISIADGLEYLGVEPWTPQLKKVCEEYAAPDSELRRLKQSLELKLEYTSSVDEPLDEFFSMELEEFSYYYNLGVSLSATYIPMETNLYDATSLRYLMDPEFVERFHYAFGFYRKALYIDTNVSSAVDAKITGMRGELQVATLGDLLQTERDISLYVDDKFYNVNTLSELQGKAYTLLSNTANGEKVNGTEEGGLQYVMDAITEVIDEVSQQSMGQVVKTAGVHVYSEKVYDKTSKWNVTTLGKDSKLILSQNAIENYLRPYSSTGEETCREYTVMQPFAIVSGIYRHNKLYDVIRSQSLNPSPVFVSSSTLPAMEGISRKDWNTIYNYVMLRNLSDSMSTSYKATLDLDSPVYMDIYGNIVTESGYVVIPAMSNATLCDEYKWTPYTAGYLTLADNGYEIPGSYTNAKKFAAGSTSTSQSGYFRYDSESKTYRVASRMINGYYINFRDLPVSDEGTMQTLLTLATNALCNNKYFNFEEQVYLISEVMRGAPIENIDKSFEGLEGAEIDSFGIYLAYKFEEFAKQFMSNSNGNSLLSFPDFENMQWYEVAVMLFMKVLFAILLVMLFVSVFLDVVQKRLGLKSVVRFVSTIVLVVCALYAVPEAINMSYYTTNKLLLQDEASKILMLNLEKQNDGHEVGVAEITRVDSSTDMYLKVGNVEVPWYKAVAGVLKPSMITTMETIYEDASKTSITASLPGVEMRGNTLYMSLDDIFQSTEIVYDTESKVLRNVATETLYASYYTPYYAILDTLVARANAYNKEQNYLAFTTEVQSRGEVRTKGYVKPYFESIDFMESSIDVVGLREVYEIPSTLAEVGILTEADISSMQSTYWCRDLRNASVVEYMEKIERKAREFVAENHTLLGKVSDETFLKVMAMYIATQHNKIMGIDVANSFEIYQLDTRDIIRLSMTGTEVALTQSSKSFARFIYDNTGTLGIAASTFLVVVYFISMVIKPTFILLISVLAIGTILIRRLLHRDEQHCIEGFIISIGLLCGTNIVFALCLKGTMLLSKLSLAPIVGILLQIGLQVLYVVIMVLLLKVVIGDWRSMGYSTYSHVTQNLITDRLQVTKVGMPPVVKTMPAENADVYASTRRKSYYDKKRRTAGYKGTHVLDTMYNRDRRRGKGRRRVNGRVQRRGRH